MTVSLSPRLMSLLLYDIIKEQICKKINICKRSVSLYIIGDWNFKSKPEWWIQSVNSNSLEIGIRNLDRPIFKLKLRKKDCNLQTFLQLCSIRSAYLGNCAFFCWSFSFKNVMKMIFSQFKNTHNKEKVSSFEEEQYLLCLEAFLIF